MVKAGFYGAKKVQRWKCQQCGKRISDTPQTPFGADIRLSEEKVVRILHCLVEGNSVRSTARLCDVEKKTVLSILKIAGERCERFLEQKIDAIPVQDLQLDECWSYVFKKDRNKTPEELKDSNTGDQFIYIALDRNTKLIAAWHLGKRDRDNTFEFISKVRHATADSKFDVSTDGFKQYAPAISLQLSDRASHSIVVKVFDKPEDRREAYCPPKVVRQEKSVGSGRPNLRRACTSHVERKNGSLRQWCRRLTRLTYAFSKKKENLRAALALHFWYYDFARIHGSLKVTPAMEAGVATHVFSLNELVSSV
jgi:transposase-like protein/IS1 family transposase